MEDTTMMDGPQPLFDGLTFVIIPNSIPDEQRRQLADDIAASGGTLNSFDTTRGRIEKLEEITHIISATSDFPDYYRALDLFIHVVKPGYVGACLKINKVKNPRAYSPDPVLFLSDVVICCGDIPEGDKEAIEGGVIAMGGQFTASLTKQVTHLIALSIDDARCQLALEKKLRCSILLPHWFDDCLKLGRKISERPYVLPDPEILNVLAGAIPPAKTSSHIRDATSAEPPNDTYPPTPPEHLEPSRAVQAFKGKNVMLSDDLALNNRLKDVIVGLMKAGGCKVTEDVEEADIYVCNYREGSDYIKASQAKKDVGNLSWLYYMITHNIWTNPMRRMMHYPRPAHGLPGFEKYKVSISSYTGEARVYLENLVRASGAEFTKTFKQDNTHLITAHKQSEKCEAAEEWGVHVVNHLWLEESYAKCKEQTLTDPRYNFFPTRTNLGEVLGQTELDRDAVEKHYFSKTRKSKTPASSAPKARTNSDQVPRSSPLVQKSGRRTKSDVATPIAARHLDGKENQTPGTTGSRGAKNRALSKLQDSAPDIAKFEKEMKRKGGVIHGGRRQKEDEGASKAKKSKGRDSPSSKRSIDEVDPEDETTEDEVAEDSGKQNKKTKKNNLTPIKHRMMVTGDKRWQDNAEKEAKDKAKLRELGLFVQNEPKNVNFLCAPKVVRTEKFIAALACGPTIVSSSYLDYALKHNKLPDPQKHLLTDPQFEKQHGFRVSEALERATQNQKRLLRDWTIFCTEKITGKYETYKHIVEANGGQMQMWKGRTTSVAPAKRTIDPNANAAESQNQEEDEGDVLYLISDPDKKEFPMWKKFRELAEKHDMVPRIVKTEWLLFVTMAQYVHWDPEWELTEDSVNAMPAGK